MLEEGKKETASMPQQRSHKQSMHRVHPNREETQWPGQLTAGRRSSRLRWKGKGNMHSVPEVQYLCKFAESSVSTAIQANPLLSLRKAYVTNSNEGMQCDISFF